MKSKILQVSFTSCPSKRWESIPAPRGVKQNQRLVVIFPLFSQGYLVNWDVQRKVWDHLFGKEMFKVCTLLHTWPSFDETFCLLTSLAHALPLLVAVCSGGVCGHQRHHHWAVLQLLVHSGVDEWDPVWGVPVPVSSQNKWLEKQSEDCLRALVPAIYVHEPDITQELFLLFNTPITHLNVQGLLKLVFNHMVYWHTLTALSD